MALIKALVLPPGSQLLLALIGFLLLWRRRRTGNTLLALSLVSLYLFSLAPVSKALLMSLEVQPPLSDAVEAGDRGAIVVLGGGRYPDAPEYGADTVDAGTLERLRYAAALQAETGLPILASGGVLRPGREPEADLMARALQDFHGSAKWLETKSRNTAENARLCARLLQAEGISRVFLVTHAAHMSRALWAFEQARIETTPAPTAYASYKMDEIRVPWFVPSLDALNGSHTALYEIFGLWWYRLWYE